MTSKIRVFIADDHGVVRHGLRALLGAQPDMCVAGEAADGRAVLGAALDDCDVLLLDLSLPRVHGIEVLRRLHRSRPLLPIVVLSMYPAAQFAARVLADGASAYVAKDRPPLDLLAAIRAAAVPRGPEALGAPGASDAVATAHAASLPHHRLTAREHQVLTLLAGGRTASEIAAELDIVASTVSNHMSAVKEKLGARSLAEVILYAHRAGLVP